MTDELALLGGTPVVKTQKIPAWPDVSNEEIEAVNKLLSRNILSIYDRSGIYEEFETNFARYHDVKYALSHNSGTSSLHAAFFAAGLGPGDEVLAPTYTFLATVTPIFQVGAAPVLCEMDPETLTIDPEDAAARVTPRTKAIVVTHMWGHPCEMDRLMEIAQANNLILIEDCSHAHGATYKGRKLGTIGHMGCFSLEGHKAIYAGEGGMLITNEQEFYERAILLGHFGKRAKQEVMLEPYRRYIETGFGHKYRMHPLGAAIANISLKYLDQKNEIRRQNMTWFSQRISNIPGIVPPITRSHSTRGGWYGYKPLYKPEDLGHLPLTRYIDALLAEGVPIKKPGSKPLHLLPLFQDFPLKLAELGSFWRCYESCPSPAYQKGDFPIAEKWYSMLLSLPVFAQPALPLLEEFAAALEKVAGNFEKLQR